MRLITLLQFERILKGKGKKTRLISRGSFQYLDDEIAPALKRKRGNREKLIGGQMLEKLAKDLVSDKKLKLQRQGMSADDALAEACQKVGKMIGAAPSTVEGYYKGKNRRERQLPNDKRSFSRRKQKVRSPKID